jgi:hypothetical protein
MNPFIFLATYWNLQQPVGPLHQIAGQNLGDFILVFLRIFFNETEGAKI